MRHIGEILALNMKELRKERGWRQADLAERAGMGVEAIKKLETAAAGFSRESVSKIAQAFGVDESRLFSDPDLVITPAPKTALKVLENAIDGKDARIKELEKAISSQTPLLLAVQRLLDRLPPDIDERDINTLLVSLETVINAYWTRRNLSTTTTGTARDLKKHKIG